MYCPQCGTNLPEMSRFCTSCGVAQNTQTESTPVDNKRKPSGLSAKINDPAFAKYIKNTNRWAAIFSGIMAVVAIVGFTVAGEMGVDNMENPQAFFQGLGIGGMFLLIALYTIVGRKRSKTWDGTVINKTVQKKKRQEHYSDNDYRWVEYLEYAVVIKSDNGKEHKITVNNDDTVYNYYRIGDRIRHHGGLKSYEKYDKSGDSIIFCNACATLCDINDDTCFRCGCPLLK